MSHENTTEAISTKSSDGQSNGQAVGSNSEALNHADEEQLAYDPVPLHFGETVRVHVRHIGKLPVAPFPVED